MLPFLFKMLETNIYTVGFPLGLALSTIFYFIYYKWLMVPCLTLTMKEVHSRITLRKKLLFSEAISNIKSVSRNRRTEILEIGVGAGENFKHFPEDSNVYILDKTDRFLANLKESYKVRPDLQIEKLIVERAERMKDIESNSMDFVVHTFILCSVDNCQLVLDEIYRVLKPGGVCLFIEHSLDMNNWFIKIFQQIIGPFWFLIMDCKFVDIKGVLEKGPYDSLKLESTSCLGFLSDPVVFGYSQKF